jgi:hypothetical protein
MTDDQAEALMNAAAAALSLPVDPAHRPGVIANLRLAAHMAALVEGKALTIHQEPAPVYRP